VFTSISGFVVIEMTCWPAGQDRIVGLIKPEICNLDAVDEQVDELECSKIGCPGYNQTSVIA